MKIAKETFYSTAQCAMQNLYLGLRTLYYGQPGICPMHVTASVEETKHIDTHTVCKHNVDRLQSFLRQRPERNYETHYGVDQSVAAASPAQHLTYCKLGIDIGRKRKIHSRV